MVSKIIGRFLSSIISVMLIWVWAVQCSGLVAALIPSLDNVATTSSMIKIITIVVSIVAIVLIWSGLMNLSKVAGVKVTTGVISGYFLSLIIITVAYMAKLGEIKYVMLAEVAGAWIIWFVILSALSNIRKRIEDTQKVESGKPEEASASETNN